MATLVFSTIGGAIGGPVGAMLGSLVGQVVDRELLFKPKGREGPRLTELALQTSSYGTPIPQLFGTMRVAGSVIWATDLVEHRHRDGGKGRPTVTSYSYTASFAVALSARPILSVGRIWADGKLLRGAAGDWKARTGFRLHHGGEDQAVDPLIASAEGMAAAPAHRGIAYAVFEDLELADYGNRIPALTFEVTADAGPVAVGVIAETLSRGAVRAGGGSMPVEGFSAYGDTVRSVVEPLALASGAWPMLVDGRLELASGAGPTSAIEDRARAVGQVGSRTIDSPDRVPRRIAVSHYDPARDYQAGVQIASAPGGQERERRIELPAVLGAGAAKQLAQAELARVDAARTRRIVQTGWSGLRIVPGARVMLAGEPGMWRVADASVQDGVELTLVPLARSALAAEASPGRVNGAPDRVHGATILHAFELPHLGTDVPAGPRVSIAACGNSPGWRKAALAVSGDSGGRWDAIGATAAPAVIGRIISPAASASALIADETSTLIVELAHDGLALADADADALDAGANLALAGDELLQFARAEPLGERQWALSGLWRGRRGTEAAIGTAAADARFVLIEREVLVARDVSAGAGAHLRVMATGVGDPEPVEVEFEVSGRSATPPAPVRLRVEPLPEGGRMLRWTRRSRSGWRWTDGTDAPIGESAERYQIRFYGPGRPDVILMTDLPELLLPEPEPGETGTVAEVRQAGDHGLSPPAAILLNDEME